MISATTRSPTLMTGSRPKVTERTIPETSTNSSSRTNKIGVSKSTRKNLSNPISTGMSVLGMDRTMINIKLIISVLINNLGTNPINRITATSSISKIPKSSVIHLLPSFTLKLILRVRVAILIHLLRASYHRMSTSTTSLLHFSRLTQLPLTQVLLVSNPNNTTILRGSKISDHKSSFIESNMRFN